MIASLIMSVYNTEAYLQQAIDSVVAQTFDDWELIIVDDGSTDRSAEIIDASVARDNRIKAIHKNNSGQADSRNIAIDKAQGKYIGFIDSDDWYEPDFLECLVHFAENEQLDIAICGIFEEYIGSVKTINADGKPIILNHQEALNEVVIDDKIKSYPCDKIFRREVITDRFPVDYFYEDYAVVFKWFMNAQRVGMCGKPLYHYRQRKSSTIHKKSARNELHFFLANYERTKFLIKNDITPTLNDWLREKFVSTTFTEVKMIVRTPAVSRKDFSMFGAPIRPRIKEFLQYANLTSGQLRRLKFFIRFPNLYYFYMRLPLIFSSEKIQNDCLYD